MAAGQTRPLNWTVSYSAAQRSAVHLHQKWPSIFDYNIIDLIRLGLYYILGQCYVEGDIQTVLGENKTETKY